MTKQERKNIDFIFEQCPELLSTGSKEQYARYVKTIFPSSSTHSIFFHGGRKGIEKFIAPSDKDAFKKNKGVHSGTKDYGIYFTADKSLAKNYAKGHPKNNRRIYAVVLNMQNPFKTDAWFALNIRRALGDKSVFNPQSITQDDYDRFIAPQNHDSVLWHGEKGEAVVFDPEQIHILGSGKDVRMFGKWVEIQKRLAGKKREAFSLKPFSPKETIQETVRPACRDIPFSSVLNLLRRKRQNG